jgi:hypothetical protein
MMQSWLDLLPRQTNTRLLNRSVWSLLEFAFNEELVFPTFPGKPVAGCGVCKSSAVPA